MAPTKSSNSTVVVKVVPQKLRRNERERKRVNQVNQGFNQLRERVPRQPGCKQKLSKVETLREAARYIHRLQIQLGIPTTPNPLIYDNFPTPENSPNYPPPIHSNIQSTSNSQHVSPYYPNAQDFQKYAPNNFQSQISPGSSSFYSNSDAGSNYEENYMQS